MEPKINSNRANTGNKTSTPSRAKQSKVSAGENSKNNRAQEENDPKRRRCVSTACIACRRRKSKCDGAQPACAACVSVYNTQCIYDPTSDHRRKGVYKKDIDNLKTRNSTLQTLIQAILNYPEDDIPELIWKIRSCESLDKVAESIAAEQAEKEDEEESATSKMGVSPPVKQEHNTFESRLASQVGEMRLESGAVRMLGGTSNLLFAEDEKPTPESRTSLTPNVNAIDPIASWTNVTSDSKLITHLLTLYFTWHYTFFTVIPKASFYKQFYQGKPLGSARRGLEYCTPLLVNAILALGCHFTSHPAARSDPEDSATVGDHFFGEAKRLVYEEDELATPKLPTVQALALMSVREVGCGREAKGWVYSGMAFRMASDLGLNFHSSAGTVFPASEHGWSEEEEDARRISFWGCFMIDKCWSQYVGRLPMFQLSSNVTAPKFTVIPSEDAEEWTPYTDNGFISAHSQPSRVRAVALQISVLSEISSDLIRYFYHPQQADKPVTKQQEMRHLSELHSRLEQWKRELPKELEAREGSLSSVLIMHMLSNLLYIHLFRPFLKYTQDNSPLPSHVSPRKLCTQAAGSISKLMRLYKRSHGLRQIVNIAVYMCHSACTIHLLNLPDKIAKRDLTHGVKHLEEIAEGWLCARRTLRMLNAQARTWKIELPEEAAGVLARANEIYGDSYGHKSTDVSPEPGQSTMASAPNLQNLQNFHQYDVNPHGWNYAVSSETQGQNAMQPLQNFPPPLIIPNGSANNLASGPESGQFPSPTNTFFARPGQHSDSNYSSPGYVTPQVNQGQSIPTYQPGTESDNRKRKQSVDFFGGVEALLRDSNDWWTEGQQQQQQQPLPTPQQQARFQTRDYGGAGAMQ